MAAKPWTNQSACICRKEAEEDGAHPASPVSYGPKPNQEILDPVKIALNIYHHKSTPCQSDTQTNHFQTTAFHPIVQNKLSPILKSPVVFNSWNTIWKVKVSSDI